MRIRLTTMVATLALASLGVAGNASAATLYTSAAHTTAVSVGSLITMGNASPYLMYTSSGTIADACSPGSITLQVTQNSGGVFQAAIVGRTLSCPSGLTPVNNIGDLTVSGGGTASGTATSWSATTLTGRLLYGANYFAESFAGTGTSTQQPTTAGAPVSVVLDHAASLTFSGTGVAPRTAGVQYTFQSGAAAYSLG